jgi:hypothetical protein
MSRTTMFAFAVFLILAGVSCMTRAGEPGQLDATALQAWANRSWDKAALMDVTVEVGRYRGMPVVAEHPCADVCPQYTVRIIHYRLPPDVSCASVGGVEKEVLVPFAIAVRSETVCVPDALVASGLYYGK